MSQSGEISFPGERITLVATANGKARLPVFLFDRMANAGQARYTDTLNPINKRERERFLADVEEALRPEVDGLLMRLAAEIAARAVERKDKATAPAVAFPTDEAWGESVDGAALLASLMEQIRRYVVLPPTATVALSLWILHTFAADVAHYTAYILLTSPTRQCGKTTLLEILSHIAFRAWRTDGATAAALYRRIHRDAPTVLLDEIDTRLHGEGSEAIRGVLDSGYQQGGKHTVCVGDQHDVQDFNTYSPKVLSGIGRPWDTVTSRSIPIRMQRATKVELRGVRKVRGHLIADECSVYRRQALRWAIDHRDELRDADPEVPDELGARQADVWRGLLAIADAVGGDWPDRARNAALSLHGVAEQEGDYGLLLLTDTLAIVRARRLESTDGKEPSGLLTADLLDALQNAGDDRPWAEYSRDGRPISPRQLATLFGRFDIKPRNVRAGSEVKKGYALVDLEPAFRRYLQTAATDEGQGDDAVPLHPLQGTTEPVSKLDVADVADGGEGSGPHSDSDRGEAWRPDESQAGAVDL